MKLGLIGTLVSAAAIVFIITQINLDLFVDAWARARYVYLLPCIVLLLAGLVTRGLRWRVLLDNALPLHRAFSIMNVAYLVNGLLPLRIGELARIYLAGRSPQAVPGWRTASTIIVERLLDLLAVVVLMSAALTAGPVPASLQSVGVVMGIGSLVGFIILLLLAGHREHLHRILSFTMERTSALSRLDLATWLDQFLDGLQPLTRPRALIMALLWTAVSWLLSVVAGYVLMFAFFDQGDWAVTALYIAAAAFAIALPAVPGNVGTYEASILLALVAMGYEQSDTAIAFAVMVHAVNVMVHAATGLIGFVQEGISLDQLSRGVRQMQTTESG